MIEFQDVSFQYTGQESDGLKDFRLTINKGEFILFCGASGCGKTTITRLVNGLIPGYFPGTLTGRVLVDSMDISELPMYEIAGKIGSVFQNPRTQFFNTDTDSEIAFGLENKALSAGEIAQRTALAVKELNLKDLCGKSIFSLSGGEKQRIAFASVYAMNPDIYLLDEPSSNLDSRSIEDLKDCLSLIKKQGRTVLIAEHRLYYLKDLADRIVYLKNGRIEKIFSPKELCELPDTEREEMGLRAYDLASVHFPALQRYPKAPILEIKDLSIRYGKKVLLQHIHLKASAGEIIGIVGENGCGKTTFSRSLCGLHRDCEGEILLHGRKTTGKTRRAASFLVMQDVNYQLFAESVEKECRLGLRNPDEKLIEDTLEKLDLLPFKSLHPYVLSGGQKQRLAVAVSIICRKEILLFDEPTSGLDYKSMTRVAGLMKALSEQDKVIFVVTHDYEFLSHACSRILHFKEGALYEDFETGPGTESRIRNALGLSPSDI